MTLDELDDALDAMARVAEAGEHDLAPGLVTVETDHWVQHLSGVRATVATLADGLRYRDVKIVVAQEYDTAVLSRRSAGDRGQPYRDLSPRSQQ